MKKLSPLPLPFVFVLAVLLLAALPAHAAKDRLVIGITQYPSSFHPNIDSMLAKSYVLGLARRPITVYDRKWNLVCMLCTELPTMKNGLAKREKTPGGKDGVAVTYKLDPKAVWGDGTPITATDVRFTWDVGRHPKSGVSNTEFYRSLYKIDEVDTKTVTLHFDKLTFRYNDVSGFDLLPAHIDRANFAEPAEYKHRTAYDTDTTNPGLYFGPYRITEAVTGSHVVLEPNPRWWGKKPAFKRITVRVIENTAALEANLLSGGLDMIAGELGLTIDQAVAFSKRHGGKYNVIFKPGLIYEHIDLNLDNPILADKRVRQALIMGINRRAISSKLFGGRQPVAHTNVNPLDWVNSKHVPKYKLDTKTAIKLLEDAGWTTLKNGIRHNAAGKPLQLTLMSTAGNRSRELVEQVLQSQWRRIGVHIRIKNEPARVFFGKTVTERRFPAMAMYAWLSSPESVPRTTLHSEAIPTAANNWAGQNYMGFSNREMDKLIESIEVELDRKKRKSMWKRLQTIYAEELPVLPLYFRANAYVLPHWLKGVQPTGHQYSTTLWVENWSVE